MAFRYPSGSNTFLPRWDQTGILVSATRDPSKFKLPQYIQYVGVKARYFPYLKLDLDEPTRIVTSQEYAWAPGQDAPVEGNIGAFQYVFASTVKYAYPWTLPQEAIDQAEWPIESSQMGIVMSKAMTNRTILVSSLAQTASNWPSTNTATANTLNGGAGSFLTASSDPSSANYLAIRKALVKACTTIVLQTNGVMKWADQNFVCSPGLANGMGNTSEIIDYLKGSPDAKAKQEGTPENMGEYNLPAQYASVQVVVEDAVRTTTRVNVGSAGTSIGSGATKAFVWQDATPVLMSRKGGVTAQYGGQSLSTIQLFAYREMESFSKNDTDNEREMGRIVDDIVCVLPFGQSGFCIQNAN